MAGNKRPAAGAAAPAPAPQAPKREVLCYILEALPGLKTSVPALGIKLVELTNWQQVEERAAPDSAPPLIVCDNEAMAASMARRLAQGRPHRAAMRKWVRALLRACACVQRACTC